MSVDAMESRTSGFVVQLRGLLTKRQNYFATMSKDHFYDLNCAHLHTTNDGQSLIEGKLAFEAYSRKHGVNILHYHADNGQFADAAFVNDTANKNQTVSHCASNAHHQNGRAEKAIRDLTEKARITLLHSLDKWSAALSVHL